MVEWNDLNALMNAKKTQEIVFGSPPDSHRTPILIHNETIKQVSSDKYVGVWIDLLLSWEDHVDLWIYFSQPPQILWGEQSNS